MGRLPKNVISLRAYKNRKHKEEKSAQVDSMLYTGCIVEILGILNNNVHPSNADYVVGAILEYVELEAGIFRKPGEAARRIERDPKLAAEPLNRARKIREKIKRVT